MISTNRRLAGRNEIASHEEWLKARLELLAARANVMPINALGADRYDGYSRMVGKQEIENR